MISLYKKRGETPLQALDRLRVEHPELVGETLSYAGRLDPMAEGVIPVLVGKEENKNRKDYLEKDKEYEVHFLIGCSTDTHDVLGVIKESNFTKIDTDTIIKSVENLKRITEQTYPWYSSKTVNGKPLFEYAREGIFDIQRPTRNVQIYSVSDIAVYEINFEELCIQNITDVQNVEGDFRQEEVIKGWENLKCHPKHPLVCHPCEHHKGTSILINQNMPNQDPGIKPLDSCLCGDDNFKIQLVSCVLKVSSGTYIRSMTETLSKELGVPVLVQKLIRTKVF